MRGMSELKVKVTGESPLMMHNGQLADPLNPYTRALKAITGKRKKTDDDYREAARIEFLGGLYFDESVGIYIPGTMIEACLLEAAKLQRLKKTASRSIFVPVDKNPLEYKGPSDPEALFEDKGFVDTRGVRVQQSRVMRTRAIFKVWALSFSVFFGEDTINRDDVVRIVHDAGTSAGLGDYRPRFGRFIVESIK